MEQAPVPSDAGKTLRCCNKCRLVKTIMQFEEQGCENECFGPDQATEVLTTAKFSGLISVMDPQSSWAAKWLHISRKVPGCYALAITDPHAVGEHD